LKTYIEFYISSSYEEIIINLLIFFKKLKNIYKHDVHLIHIVNKNILKKLKLKI